MRNRIFVKLLAAFVLVIAAATITLDFSIRHGWEAAASSGVAVQPGDPTGGAVPSTVHMRRTLLLGSALAFVVAMAVAGLAAQSTARRLRRIVQFADKIAAGDLTARIAEHSGDEIGQVTAALDKTARELEQSFAALQTSQRQLETLLNSMQDAVLAVADDERVQWANQTMERLVPQRTRRNAPVVETVRDPDFLRAIRGRAKGIKCSRHERLPSSPAAPST